MVEKDYYPAINKYYLKNIGQYENTIVWEAKITKGNTLPFSCLAPHQEENLLAAERAMAHKIADVGRHKKPMDGIVVYKATAIIVAVFYKPREAVVYEIYIRDFLKEKYESGERSLSQKRAQEIAFNIMKL